MPLKSHHARGLPRLLRHRGKTRRVKGTVNERRGRFNDAPSIHDRLRSAENRSWYGHWEGDTVRGSEFARYRELAETLDAKVFFPDPHAPQQRDTNENTNGLI